MGTSVLLCCALAVFGFLATSSLGALTGGVEDVIHQKHIKQLGLNECTYGPGYWCSTLKTAAKCKAVNHCIQTTWETQYYPEDNDDICTICKNMVKEARDTLESNITLDELKQVFYGSCQLLPLKIVKNECKKLSDEFIPELVDTLASQMDPNVVCTVSGLCNNERIDELLRNSENKQLEVSTEYSDCQKCAIAMDKGEDLVQKMSRDDLLNKVLMMCGELSSYSDACSSIVLRYNNEIYNGFKNYFSIRNVCMLSGMCPASFQPYADDYEESKGLLMDVEINNAGERGRIQKSYKKKKVSDDLTCEFCESMVKHLRDILVANTTEEQFLDVLTGLCKQTRSFSQECLEMVNNNYGRVYQFLLTELNGKVLCSIIGICPNTRYSEDYIAPRYPLIPVELLQTEASNSFTEKEKVVVDEQPPKVKDIKKSTVDIFTQQMHFVVNVDMPTDKTACFLCQSILNYVQQVVTDPKSEEEIRSALEKSCLIVPSSYESQCKQFIDQYGDAFISLIAQEVDPSIICPELKLCPATDLSIITNKDSESIPECSMCIIFMSALESDISNNNTEAELKNTLEKLCTKLPTNWKAKCSDFVTNNLESILDMLIAQIPPQEICVLLNICTPKTISDSAANEIESNMIATSGLVTVVLPGYNMGQLLANNYKMLEEPKIPTPFCLVCTVVMKYLNSEIEDKSNQDEIEKVMNSVCRILPNVEESECEIFIYTNYRQIINALKIGTNPAIACMALMVCEEVIDETKYNIEKMSEVMQPTTTKPVELDTSSECTVCEAFVSVFNDRLNNKSVNIDEIDLMELCYEVDIKHKEQCLEMINSYNQTFKNLYHQLPTWMMCEKMSLCSKNKSVAVNKLNNTECLKGFNYWCASKDNAKECKAEMLCNRTTWNVNFIEK